MNKVIQKEGLCLCGERLFLRPVTVGDITSEYIDGLNDPDINRYLVLAKPQTMDSVRQYVQMNWDHCGSILFGLFEKNDSGALVGTIRVSDINWNHYLANIGVCLFIRRLWKKGYALEAMACVVKYLFHDLGLHYLEAGVYAENHNSMMLFQRAGFEEVYKVKRKYFHDGVFKEVVFWGIYNKHFVLDK